jgi:DNA polymerase III delta subunit
MIYIVHGDDYPKSRRLIINQQKKLAMGLKTEMDISDTTPKELFETACSFDIFGNAPFVVLNIPSTKVANAQNYIEVMKKIPEKTVLIILCDRELGRTNAFYKSGPELKAKVVLNAEAQDSNVFKFVDQVFMKNKRGAYKELEKLHQEDTNDFYILSMLNYGLRNITHAKYHTDDFSKKSSFIKNKAVAQADNFSVEEIRNLYTFMYEVDKKLKTGLMDHEVALVRTIEKITEL